MNFVTILIVAALITLILWSFIWKGLALWHTARRGELVWFVIFLVVNTAGLLEMLYLFRIAKLSASELVSRPQTNDTNEA